nr:biotin/lipoyl-containing protein [uncultured Roseibium sp.]
MTTDICVPFLGVNDTEAQLQDWLVNPGDRVSPGDDLCILETTKATIEVSAEAEGFVFPLAQEGDTLKVDQVIGFCSEDPHFDLEGHLAALAEASSSIAAPTKKAELLIARNGLDLESVQKFAGDNRVTEQAVLDFMAKDVGDKARLGFDTGTRVGIIGGVSGGGALIVADALARISSLHAAAIYDRDERFHGKTVLGLPVAGNLDMFLSDVSDGKVDAAVLAFNSNLEERDRVFNSLVEQGVRFVNVIDPSADIRSGVELGVGNVILGHVYIGAGSRLKDNNFVSANVALEHGNVLGSSCAFGPGVFTSGNVSIGDRVRFGTGIFVEPGLSIGDDSVIGSGRTIVTGIKANTRLTSQAKA